MSNLPPLTASIQKTINTASQSVLWFEAYFNQKANADASNNAAPLVTGQMSAQQYMSTLQRDRGVRRKLTVTRLTAETAPGSPVPSPARLAAPFAARQPRRAQR